MSSLVRKLPNPRWLHLGGALLCLAAMIGALWLQYGVGLEPCPLCIFQRVAMITTGVIFLVAGLHNPRRVGRCIYAALAGLAALAGAGVAIRHLWLQQLPPGQVPACGPGLNYMLEVFPLQDVIAMVLSGSGSCAEVHWRLLGLSLPGWSLIAFVLLVLLALVQLLRRHD